MRSASRLDSKWISGGRTAGAPWATRRARRPGCPDSTAGCAGRACGFRVIGEWRLLHVGQAWSARVPSDALSVSWARGLSTCAARRCQSSKARLKSQGPAACRDQQPTRLWQRQQRRARRGRGRRADQQRHGTDPGPRSRVAEAVEQTRTCHHREGQAAQSAYAQRMQRCAQRQRGQQQAQPEQQQAERQRA